MSLIFFLRTDKRTRIFLSKIEEASLEKETAYTGFYGREPSMEDVKIIRETLRKTTLNQIKALFAEQWFIPRFLGAAGIFLVVFFVLSFGIRDPLPYVDELVVAFGISALAFWAWSRTGLKSVEFQNQVKTALEGIDKTSFEKSARLETWEKWLMEAEKKSVGELWEILALYDPDEPAQHDDPWIRALRTEVATVLKRCVSAFKRLQGRSKARKTAELEALIQEGLDIPLLVVYFTASKEGFGPVPFAAEVPGPAGQDQDSPGPVQN